MNDWTRRAAVLVLLPFVATLIAVTGANSLRWLDTTIPGFFIMQNRVVPSVMLPSWDAAVPALFQQQVVAVDGVRVTSAAEVYGRVQQATPETPIHYTLRGREGIDHQHVVRARRFTEADYLFLFGALLLTGTSFIVTGLVVYFLRPRSAASLGLLSAGIIGGVFVVTAADLYGPGWFFRLHVCAEALVPASLLHLALVFPTERLRGQRAGLLRGAYMLCGGLAVVYEGVLGSPAAYTAAHLTATTAQGVGGLVLVICVAYDLLTTSSPHVRRQILFAALGILAAFFVPAILMSASGLLGGSVPINSSALCGFLFPLSLGYAMVKRDLLAVDVFLRRLAMVVLALISSVHLAQHLHCAGQQHDSTLVSRVRASKLEAPVQPIRMTEEQS